METGRERCRHWLSILMELLSVLYHSLTVTAKAIIRSVFFFLPREYKDISDEIVLITGGGRGMGRLLAVQFAKHHPKQIILWGRNEDMLSATTQAIKLMRIPCAYMICDVSDREQVYRKAQLVKEKYGNVGILVNNAGVVYGMNVIDSITEQMEQTVHTNLLGQIWTTKAFLPAMMQANHGHIVSISSMLGLMGLPGAADYSASKHGTTAFMRCLALELAADGYSNVHTTCVHPYLINNEMFAGVTTRFPFLFPALNKEYVSWKTLDAVLTNSPDVLMPRMMYFLHFVRSLLPVNVLWAVSVFTGVDTAMNGFHARRKMRTHEGGTMWSQ